MSKDNLFDDITRLVGSGMPRRGALRLMGGALVGAGLSSLGFPRRALARVPCPHTMDFCDTLAQCKPGGGCCAAEMKACNISGNDGCCAMTAQCKINGGCCAAGMEACHAFNNFDCCAKTAQCKDEGGCCAAGMEACHKIGNGGCCTTVELCVRGGGCCDPGTVACPNTRACCPTVAHCKKGGGCCPKPCPGNTTGKISAIRSGPPAQADATIQNAVEGISAITLAKAVNCTVASLPVTGNAIKTPIILTATKIDQTKPAQFVCDVCTPDTPKECCCSTDPIFTVLKLTTGQWARQTFADVPAAERFITVTNGNPGLTSLHIWVNSKHFATLSLRDNQTQSLSLAAAMTETDNTISLVGGGDLGASASVAILDTAPAAAAASNSGMGAVAAQGQGHRHNAIWGPLAEETEENSHLHAANAASQTVQVNFNGALGAGAASNPSVYTVEVNGKATAVQTAHVQAGAAGMNLTLQLPPGTLHSRDSVDVYWENLRDAKGRPLAGHVPLFAQ